MTITPITPAPTRLAEDLHQAQEILARVTAELEAAGPGAQAFTRTGITVQSPEAVEALAAIWGVVPRWTAERTQYMARWTAGGHGAEAEAVYYAPAPEAAGSEAAA